MKLLTILLGFFGVVVPLAVFSFAPELFRSDPPACKTRWTGEIGQLFADKVRDDLKDAIKAKCKKLEAILMSPGGSVVWSVESSQEIKRARAKGLVVEIRGRSLVASGAVLILASGSPGHRVVTPNSLALVHGVQEQTSIFEPPQCVDLVKLSKETKEDAVVTRRIIIMLVSELADSIGKPFETVEKWFRCGKEQVGSGSLLVELGIADKEGNYGLD